MVNSRSGWAVFQGFTPFSRDDGSSSGDSGRIPEKRFTIQGFTALSRDDGSPS